MNLTITAAAARFMRMMGLTDGAPGGGFRLAVKPGGCSGLSAEMEVAALPAAGEQAVTTAGVKLFLDAQSRLLLEDVTIDFADTAASTGLVFHDPKQQAGCGTDRNAA